MSEEVIEICRVKKGDRVTVDQNSPFDIMVNIDHATPDLIIIDDPVPAGTEWTEERRKQALAWYERTFLKPEMSKIRKGLLNLLANRYLVPPEPGYELLWGVCLECEKQELIWMHPGAAWAFVCRECRQ